MRPHFRRLTRRRSRSRHSIQIRPKRPTSSHTAGILADGGPLKSAGRFLGPSAINFVAVVVLFLWSGALLGDFAFVADLVGIDPPQEDLLRWALAAGALLGGRMILRSAYKDDSAKRPLVPLGMLLMFGCAPSLIATAHDTGLWFAAIGVAGLVTALWRAGQAVLQRGQLRPTLLVFFGTLLVSIPRIVGFWLLALAATFIYDLMLKGTDVSATMGESLTSFAVFGGVVFLGIPFSEGLAPRVAAPRVPRIRWRGASPFAGTAPAVAPGADVALSDVAPPQR